MEHEHLSPKEYLMRHRLRTATEMLCTTDYSITEIALSCGFRDGSAFSGYFREQVGMTPRRVSEGAQVSFMVTQILLLSMIWTNPKSGVLKLEISFPVLASNFHQNWFY